jgi:hypothetical protein
VQHAWARPRRAGGRQLQADMAVPPSFRTEPAANVLTIIRTADADGDPVCVRPTSQQGCVQRKSRQDLRLQVVTNQPAASNTGGSRNRGTRGRPAWPTQRGTVEAWRCAALATSRTTPARYVATPFLLSPILGRSAGESLCLPERSARSDRAGSICVDARGGAHIDLCVSCCRLP